MLARRMARNTVLLVQPSFQPPGGGNALAAWMLEALRRDYRLTVCTWRPFQVEEINRYFGTSLSTDEIEALAVPSAVRSLVDAIPLPLSLLKSSLLMRFARRRMSRYDLVISANNEADFGRPGIQYVHYPAYERPRPQVDLRWYHRLPFVLAAYYLVTDWLFGGATLRFSHNLTLVNSDWTGDAFRRRHGGEPRTLYPPVAGTFADVPWAKRQGGFVCLGRIAPEKDVDTAIDIVEAVRRVHPEAHLHLVGSPGRPSYARRILARAAAHPDWITLHLDVSHDEVRRIITGHRYGLHCMEDEHFGMAPAEMVTGGCIVWVRDRGGQVEIVGSDPRLMFSSTDEAVARILEVMASHAEQDDLRALLARRAPHFSLERFTDGIRAAALEQLARQGARPADTSPRNSAWRSSSSS